MKRILALEKIIDTVEGFPTPGEALKTTTVSFFEVGDVPGFAFERDVERRFREAGTFGLPSPPPRYRFSSDWRAMAPETSLEVVRPASAREDLRVLEIEVDRVEGWIREELARWGKAARRTDHSRP